MEEEAAVVEEALALVVSPKFQPALCLAHGLNVHDSACDRFLAYVPFSAIAMTITAAAKIELYTYLACEVHKPVVTPDRDVLSFFSHSNGTLTLDRKS